MKEVEYRRLNEEDRIKEMQVHAHHSPLTTYNSLFMISWNDFEKIDIRCGTIIEVNDFPHARKPAYQLTIDFGPLGIKKSSAQITHHYTKDELMYKQVVAVVNFPIKQIANFFSECLVLGVYDENDHVVLLQADKPVTNGQKIG